MADTTLTLTDASQRSAQLADLRRVRWIAGASALVETLKLLPAIDALVLAVEWAVLKTAVPGALEVKDAWKAGVRNPLKLSRAFAAGNWFALTHRAFGGAGGAAVVALDVLTDVETLLLPAPLDGFDIPAPLADAVIAGLAHRAIRKMEHDQSPATVTRILPPTPVPDLSSPVGSKQVA